MEGTWDLGIFLDLDPLFLPAIRSLKPFLWFRAISSSSSSELLSGRVTMRTGVQTLESLSTSSLASDIGMTWAPCSSSSSRWNCSISSSSDRRDEAVSSLGAAASGRAQWRGSLTSGRSSLAKSGSNVPFICKNIQGTKLRSV